MLVTCRRPPFPEANMKKMSISITTPQFGDHGGGITIGATNAVNKPSAIATAQAQQELKLLKLQQSF